MFRKMIAVIFAGAIVLAAHNANAWDGERKGFILGGGIGGGLTSFKQEVEIDLFGTTIDLETDTENKFGFMTDFKIGYAPSNQLMIYYFSKTSWISMDNALDDTVTISSGVSGLGASYYFNPEANSFLLSGGLGYSSWATPFEDNDPWYGFGFMLGCGYEFTKYFSADFSFTYGKSEDSESGISATTTASSFMLTVNVVGY